MNEALTFFDNQIRVTVVAYEMRMSHWVNAPKVEEVSTGHVLLDLIGDLWDLVGTKEEQDTLFLFLRK